MKFSELWRTITHNVMWFNTMLVKSRPLRDVSGVAASCGKIESIQTSLVAGVSLKRLFSG